MTPVVPDGGMCVTVEGTEDSANIYDKAAVEAAVEACFVDLQRTPDFMRESVYVLLAEYMVLKAKPVFTGVNVATLPKLQRERVVDVKLRSVMHKMEDEEAQR